MSSTSTEGGEDLNYDEAHFTQQRKGTPKRNILYERASRPVLKKKHGSSHAPRRESATRKEKLLTFFEQMTHAERGKHCR